MQSQSARAGTSTRSKSPKEKLVYVLNHYSNSGSDHFVHIFNLLCEISKCGVEIHVIVEKCNGSLPESLEGLRFSTLATSIPVLRHIALFFVLIMLHSRGFETIFVRIAPIPAAIAIVKRKIFGGSVYYWQSGTTHGDEHDTTSNKRNMSAFEWVTKSLPFYFVKWGTDAFVTGPERMLDYYSNVVQVPRTKLRLLYNDIDLRKFAPCESTEHKRELKRSLGLDPNKLLLLFVHRLSPIKRTLFYLPDVLIDCIEKHGEHIQVMVVGSGAEFAELKKRINVARLQHWVSLPGAIANNQLVGVYQAADVFFNPTFEEGFPRVLLEAMACGLPLVTTDAGGIPDILGSKQLNYMVPKLEKSQFSELLIRLIDDKNKRLELSAENLEVVKKYDSPVVARMYSELLFS